MPIGNVTCKTCRKIFIGTEKAEYCSQRCKQKAYRKRKKINFELNTIYKSLHHGEFKVLNIGDEVSEIAFNDGTTLEAPNNIIISRNVVNPFAKSVFGIGYLGKGPYNSTGHDKAYRVWRSMISRCYDPKGHQSTYNECTVCDEWHNFQNFAQWYSENHPQDGKDYELDKDSLVIDNKEYSPTKCCFLSKADNVIEATTRRINKEA